MNFIADNLDKLLYIIPILCISIFQIILTMRGKTDEATRLETKKQKYLSRLTKKRDKCITKGQKYQQKINEKEKKDVSSIKE